MSDSKTIEEKTMTDAFVPSFPEFEVYKVNDDGVKRLSRVTECFNMLLASLSPLCPPSREFDLVKTKLEEACFFAKKCVASNKDNQVEVS